ncbi:MAG: trigger factor [Lachnospiraceae bacterium]|nr:trigger factor [Lachnospiraceae bacterium]
MVKVEQLEQKNMVKLIITVGADEFEKAVERAYQKNKNRIDIQGFRKGKAPRSIIEKMYGEGVFFEDAANELIPGEYSKAAEESGLKIVSRPGIDIVEIGKDKEFVFSAEVAVKPEVKLGAYKGVEVDKVSAEVTDEDIENELKKVQDQNGRLITVEDRPVQNGDTANINFEGFKDGVPFEGGKGENHDLVIGSHTFIDNFEDQIVGHSVGDEFDVNVTFHEDYTAKELAGQPAVFKCKLNSIKTKELPPIDDELASEVSDFDTLDEYKADIRKNLSEQKAKQAKQAKEDAVVDIIADNAEMDIPEPMIDMEAEQMFDDFAQRIKSQGLSIEMYYSFTGLDEDKLKEQIRPQAAKRIKTRLVLEAVAQAEGFTASDEEVDEEIKKMAESYQMELEKLQGLITDKEKEAIREDVCVTKALDFVRDNAVEK